MKNSKFYIIFALIMAPIQLFSEPIEHPIDKTSFLESLHNSNDSKHDPIMPVKNPTLELPTIPKPPVMDKTVEPIEESHEIMPAPKLMTPIKAEPTMIEPIHKPEAVEPIMHEPLPSAPINHPKFDLNKIADQAKEFQDQKQSIYSILDSSFDLLDQAEKQFRMQQHKVKEQYMKEHGNAQTDEQIEDRVQGFLMSKLSGLRRDLLKINHDLAISIITSSQEPSKSIMFK